MTSVADIPNDHDFEGESPAASDKVDAAVLDAQLTEIKNKSNEDRLAVSRVIRDDDTLVDEVVRARNLHPEITLLIGSLGGWKAKLVDVATTANITLSGEQTIDGVLTSGSRVLVKDQTDASENGVYVSAAGAWARATDADSAEDLGYAFIAPTGGDTQVSSSWFLGTPASEITLDTTDLTFIQIGGLIGVTPIAQGGTNATTASQALTNLGFSAYVKTLVSAASAAALRALIGLTTIGEAIATAVDAATARVALGLANIASSGSASDLGTGTVPAARIDQATTEVVRGSIQFSAQGFRMDVRDALTSFPVPCIRPTTANKVIAVDICPNGSPSDFSNNGRAWIDVCDTDYQTGDPAGCALRLGATGALGYLEVGLRGFNGATKKPLYITNQAIKVMEFEIDGGINTGFSQSAVVRFMHRNPSANAAAYAEFKVAADNTAKGLLLRKYSSAFSADSNNYLDRAEIIGDGCSLLFGADVVYFHSGYPFSTKRSGAYDASGNWTLGRTPAFGSYHSIGRGTTEGDTVLLIDSNCFFYRVDNLGYNAGAAALKIGKNSATSRSINAAGTVNASGADYAEYVRKADGCGPIAKAAIVGIDAHGHLTDRFDSALSFAVKSTDPSYVGGDTWGAQFGDRPVVEHGTYSLSRAIDELAKSLHQGMETLSGLPKREAEIAEELAKATAAITEAKQEMAAATAAGEAAISSISSEEADPKQILAGLEAKRAAKAHGAFWSRQLSSAEDAMNRAMKDRAEAEKHRQALAAKLPKSEADLATKRAQLAIDAKAIAAAGVEWDAKYEAERARWDRVAFSGRVPCTVAGAKPGDYIVPVRSPTGGISATAVAAPTFDQYRLAIGKVWSVDAGVTTVAVKVG